MNGFSFFFFFLADDNQNLCGKFRFFLDVGHERKILYMTGLNRLIVRYKRKSKIGII